VFESFGEREASSLQNLTLIEASNFLAMAFSAGRQDEELRDDMLQLFGRFILLFESVTDVGM
jgi:hypothetical protein